MHFGGLGKRRPLVTCGREYIGVPSPQIIRRTRQAETELHTTVDGMSKFKVRWKKSTFLCCFRLPFISERIPGVCWLTARGTVVSVDRAKSLRSVRRPVGAELWRSSCCGSEISGRFLPQARRSNLRPRLCVCLEVAKTITFRMAPLDCIRATERRSAPLKSCTFLSRKLALAKPRVVGT